MRLTGPGEVTCTSQLLGERLNLAIGTGPADPAAAGPIIWQTRIFMFTL